MLLTLVGELTCVGNYKSYGGSCYGPHTEEVAWNVAKATCEAENGGLVEIADQAEQDFVHGLLYRRIRY